MYPTLVWNNSYTKNHSALYCNAHCTAIKWAALNCTAMNRSKLQWKHRTTLHWTALHCIGLHCTALHCSEIFLIIGSTKNKWNFISIFLFGDPHLLLSPFLLSIQTSSIIISRHGKCHECHKHAWVNFSGLGKLQAALRENLQLLWKLKKCHELRRIKIEKKCILNSVVKAPI